MRTTHWIGVVVLALVLGGTVGYFAAPTPDNSVPVNDAPAPQAARGPLMETLRAIPALPADYGDGTIEGTVYDAEGKPLAGVKVSPVEAVDGGSLWPASTEGPMTDEEFWRDVNDDVTTLVQQRRAYHMPQLSAVTNADGYYRITGLPKRELNLRAELTGYLFEIVNGRTLVTPDALQDFVGTRAVKVHVVMKSPDGKKVRAGRLVVDDIVEQRQVSPFWVGKATEWTLQLPAGCYSMQVSMDSPSQQSIPQTVVVRPTESTQEVMIEFDPGRGLQVDVNPGQIAPTTLQLTCVPDVPGSDPAEILKAELQKPMRYSKNWKSTLTGMSVHFEFLRAGDYVVGAYGFGQLVGWRRVYYDGKSGRVDLELVAPPEDECIACTISTSIQRPLYPRFTIERDGSFSAELVPWRMGALTYRLQLPPADKFDRDAAGTLHLRDGRAGEARVGLATCGPQEVQVEFQAQSYLLLEWDEAQFEPIAPPAAKLFDQQGVEVSNVRVSRVEKGGTGIVLSNFYPGRCNLHVYAPDAQFPFYAADMVLEPGFNNLKLEPIELSSIEIQWKAAELESVELSSKLNGTLVKQQLSIRGAGMTLSGLAPGTYEITYRKEFDEVDHSSHFFVPRSDPVVLE